MTYDVLAVNLCRKDRPVQSVRVVAINMSETGAAIKHRRLQRSVECSRVDGEEFFVIVPHRMYREGELWQGTKEDEHA